MLIERMLPDLECPVCHAAGLSRDGEHVTCTGPDCARTFPVVAGVPVLINEARSVFRISDFEARRPTTMALGPAPSGSPSVGTRLEQAARSLVPGKSYASTDFSARAALAEILQRIRQPTILVVGAGDAEFDVGFDGAIVYTDVAHGPLTNIVADGHDLPFRDGTMDAVILVAVLEHVADPYRVVAEVARVLKPNGYVYAATPFMQQVHMGRYDFTRFTAVGHRRLFNHFGAIRMGVANGPGMALAWALEYFFTSFSEQRRPRQALQVLARVLGAPFVYFDHWLSRKRGAYDCASAYYFFGQKQDTVVSDRDIIAEYRGLLRDPS